MQTLSRLELPYAGMAVKRLCCRTPCCTVLLWWTHHFEEPDRTQSRRSNGVQMWTGVVSVLVLRYTGLTTSGMALFSRGVQSAQQRGRHVLVDGTESHCVANSLTWTRVLHIRRPPTTRSAFGRVVNKQAPCRAKSHDRCFPAASSRASSRQYFPLI